MPLPPAQKGGASARGSHFFKTWHTCQMRWFNEMLRPHPDGGLGLSPSKTDRPLLLGHAFHEGMAAWYQSRCKTGADNGQPDLDLAIDTMRQTLASRESEYADPSDLQADLDKATSLLCQYHDFYGPDGLSPEFPDLRVVVDDEGPVVEREFQIPLGPGLPSFTCRVDLLADYTHTGHTWRSVVEHKTTSGSSLSRLVSRSHVDAQITGEILVVHQAYPEEPVPQVLLNAIVKDRGARSKLPTFQREFMRRPDLMLGNAYQNLRQTMEQVKDAVARYDEQVGAGADPHEAGRQVFLTNGMANGNCVSFRPCPFITLCKSMGLEDRMIVGFRPRSRNDDEETLDKEFQV